MTALTLARRLRREIRQGLALIAGGPQDDRARGQAESLRHMQTVIQLTLWGGPRR